MPDIKIIKNGSLVLPESKRASGTVTVGDDTVYAGDESKSWSNVPVVANRRELPIAYLPDAVAWQDNGSDPGTYAGLLVWTQKKNFPVVVPRTVVLRGFFSDLIDDGIRALATTLNREGITVVKDPYSQVAGPGLYPALPITGFETVDPGHGDDPVKVGIIDVSKFVGGEILEFFRGSERESFGMYRSVVAGSSVTSSFSGYDEIYDTVHEAIIAHRTISILTQDGATGTGTHSTDTWNFSWSVVLVPKAGPPPFLEVHVKGNSIGITPEPRFPVTHTISNDTTTSYTWDDMVARSSQYFIDWIARCAKYKAVVLVEVGTDVAPPNISDTDAESGLIHISIVDGINPLVTAAVTSVAELVGSENMEMLEVASGESLEADQLSKIKQKISEFFGITL